MLTLSLLVNIAVLVPVLIWIARASQSVATAYGPDSPARRILSAVYGAILLASAVLLWLNLAGHPEAASWTSALLAIQVIYKLMTVPLVGLGNPVVASNAAIALIHSAALTLQLV